jgi:hypothetical protein
MKNFNYGRWSKYIGLNCAVIGYTFSAYYSGKSGLDHLSGGEMSKGWNCYLPIFPNAVVIPTRWPYVDRLRTNAHQLLLVVGVIVPVRIDGA